jgi:hypothetical protein
VRAPRPAWLLAVLGVLFFAAFALQRERSDFLAAEARAEESKRLAAAHGLPPCEVLALHELYGGRSPAADLELLVQRFAAARRALGDPLLAVLEVRGKGELAARLRARARDDGAEVRPLILGTREAVEDAGRFASVAERYAQRGN